MEEQPVTIFLPAAMCARAARSLAREPGGSAYRGAGGFVAGSLWEFLHGKTEATLPKDATEQIWSMRGNSRKRLALLFFPGLASSPSRHRTTVHENHVSLSHEEETDEQQRYLILLLALLLPMACRDRFRSQPQPELPLDLSGNSTASPTESLCRELERHHSWSTRTYSRAPRGKVASWQRRTARACNAFSQLPALLSGRQRLNLFTLDLKHLTDSFNSEVGKPDTTVISATRWVRPSHTQHGEVPGTYDAGIPLRKWSRPERYGRSLALLSTGL